MIRSGGLGLAATAALLLSACVGGGRAPREVARPSYQPPARTPVRDAPRQPVAARPLPPVAVAAPAANTPSARTAGVVAGPAVYALPISEERAAAALAAFRTSCPALTRRNDTSELTRAADWVGVCSAAGTVRDGEARSFFAQYFEAVQVGDGKAFATGYYEPEIAGCRTRQPGCETPIYGRPTDLIDVDLGLFSDALKGKKIRGKISGKTFVPYDDRTGIESGALGNGRAPVIAWAADPVELFFLQVQGSGRLRLPDGGTLRIGYDTQNGRDYTGIGALMRQRGLLGPGQASMQGIVQWLHDHPAEGRDIMRENRSYVFFRVMPGSPQGAMGYAVVGGASAAVDPKFVPLGAPVFLSMDRTDATGIWVAQDTGGAIKGANRFDTYWGAGDDARATAGGMSAHGTAFLLLPVGTLSRLQAEGSSGKAPFNP